MNKLTPFHLAIPVDNIPVCRKFYREVLGCKEGRSSDHWHFGVVLEWDTFHKFSHNLKEKGVEVIIEPYIRFEGKPGEQATMFFMDPAGNALEFKSFKDFNQIFAT